MKKNVYVMDKDEKKAVMFLKEGVALIEPTSRINNSFGYCTFKMEYAGTKYESTRDVPFIDLKEGQIQVSWSDDEPDELEVVLMEEA